jgi:hypothetical protein
MDNVRWLWRSLTLSATWLSGLLLTLGSLLEQDWKELLLH